MSRFGQFQVLKRERERKRDEEIVKKMVLKTCQESKAIKKCPACLRTGLFSPYLNKILVWYIYPSICLFLHFTRIWDCLSPGVQNLQSCGEAEQIPSSSHVQYKGTNNHPDSLDFPLRLVCKSLDLAHGENPCAQAERDHEGPASIAKSSFLPLSSDLFPLQCFIHSTSINLP